jgi:hypothetical protein
MIVKEGVNKALIKPFLEQSQQAELIAENFLANGRPLFNEKAYQILTDQGKKDQADRYLYAKARTCCRPWSSRAPGRRRTNPSSCSTRCSARARRRP